jgi:histone H3/H4
MKYHKTTTNYLPIDLIERLRKKTGKERKRNVKIYEITGAMFKVAENYLDEVEELII